jgi:6-pyruvoyltetrahydropterin/6-carboxytetrahydropterin synthase
MYQSTKTYTHAEGLSCCFRQWRAKSHCSFLHGYAIQVGMKFETEELDDNWVVDFGGLKGIKQWLKDNFDHKTLVAQTDPELETLQALHEKKLIDINIIPEVSCERFAEYVFNHVSQWVRTCYEDRVRLVEVEVREHGGNSAICRSK